MKEVVILKDIKNYKNLLKIYVKESRVLIKEFIALINYLTDKFDNYIFIVRPHPQKKNY